MMFMTKSNLYSDGKCQMLIDLKINLVTGKLDAKLIFSVISSWNIWIVDVRNN